MGIGFWAVVTEDKTSPVEIERYLPLVRVVAQRLHAKMPKSVDIEDLVQWGFFGLQDAAEKFRPELGVKFQTYATPRIAGAIIDGVRTFDWVPRSVRRQLDAAKKMVSMQAVIAEDSRTKKLIDSIEDDSVAPPGDRLEDREHFDYMLRGLSADQRHIINGYYRRDRKMKEIGRELGLSESRVSQLHSDAIQILRDRQRVHIEGKEDPVQNLVCDKFPGMQFVPAGAARTAGVELQELMDAIAARKPVGKDNLVFAVLDEAQETAPEKEIPPPQPEPGEEPPEEPSHSRKARPVWCVELKRAFPSARAAGIELNFRSTNIVQAIKTNTRCNGYHWEYFDPARHGGEAPAPPRGNIVAILDIDRGCIYPSASAVAREIGVDPSAICRATQSGADVQGRHFRRATDEDFKRYTLLNVPPPAAAPSAQPAPAPESRPASPVVPSQAAAPAPIDLASKLNHDLLEAEKELAEAERKLHRLQGKVDYLRSVLGAGKHARVSA